MNSIEIQSGAPIADGIAHHLHAKTTASVEQGTVRLGFACSALLLAVYGGFVLLAAFAPHILARPILGGPLTVAFGYGLGVIGAGIVLTCLYAAMARWIEAGAGTEAAQ